MGKNTVSNQNFVQKIAGKNSGIGVSFSPFFSYLSWSAVRHKKTKALGICLGGGEDADAGGDGTATKGDDMAILEFLCIQSLGFFRNDCSGESLIIMEESLKTTRSWHYSQVTCSILEMLK